MPQSSQPNIKEQFISEGIPVGFPWRLFTFSLVLFLFSIFIYFGLRFGYETYVDQRASDLDKKIETLSNQVTQEDQKDFINFYSQLVNLKKALDRHKFTANVFNFLEKSTLGEVYYSDADFGSSENSLILKGFAVSSEILVAQLSIFDGRQELEQVVLNQTQSDKAGVSFNISLNFNPDFFKTPSL